MSATVHIHPRCLAGPAYGALFAALERSGFALDTMAIGPASPKGYRQLLRIVGETEPQVVTYERMDGTRFTYDTRDVAA